MMDVADYRLRLAILFELKAMGIKPGRLSKAELRVRCPAAPDTHTQTHTHAHTHTHTHGERENSAAGLFFARGGPPPL